jgi:hypothetical protein
MSRSFYQTTVMSFPFKSPPGLFYGNKNRGFAFATVGYDGTIEALIAKLDGLRLLGRSMVVRRQLPKIPR